MKRLIACAGLQLVFVSFYGATAIWRMDIARPLLLPFVAVVWVLIAYNNWPVFRDAVRHRR